VPQSNRHGGTPSGIDWKVINSSRNAAKIVRNVANESLLSDFDLLPKYIARMTRMKFAQLPKARKSKRPVNDHSRAFSLPSGMHAM
jgi:hypothetical protein